MSYKTILNKDSYYEVTSYYKDKACHFRHREDGSAIEWKYGHKEWYVNNHLHREDGPAVEYCGGHKRYYLNGKEYEEQEYWAIIKFGGFV